MPEDRALQARSCPAKLEPRDGKKKAHPKVRLFVCWHCVREAVGLKIAHGAAHIATHAPSCDFKTRLYERG